MTFTPISRTTAGQREESLTKYERLHRTLERRAERQCQSSENPSSPMLASDKRILEQCARAIAHRHSHTPSASISTSGNTQKSGSQSKQHRRRSPEPSSRRSSHHRRSEPPPAPRDKKQQLS